MVRAFTTGAEEKLLGWIFPNLSLLTQQGIGTWLSSELREAKAVRKRCVDRPQFHHYQYKLAIQQAFPHKGHPPSNTESMMSYNLARALLVSGGIPRFP